MCSQLWHVGVDVKWNMKITIIRKPQNYYATDVTCTCSVLNMFGFVKQKTTIRAHWCYVVYVLKSVWSSAIGSNSTSKIYWFYRRNWMAVELFVRRSTSHINTRLMSMKMKLIQKMVRLPLNSIKSIQQVNILWFCRVFGGYGAFPKFYFYYKLSL